MLNRMLGLTVEHWPELESQYSSTEVTSSTEVGIKWLAVLPRQPA